MQSSHSTYVRRRLAVTTLAAGLMLGVETRIAATPRASEDVPVPGGIAALARALDIDPPDAARCLPELARLVYGEARHERNREESSYRRLMAYLATTSPPSTLARDVVPIPLTAALWSTVLDRGVTASTVFAAILSDPDAALIAHGLSALDDETLGFFAMRPELLRALYRRHATAFASFPVHLRIRGGRVITPGGDLAVPLWEGLLGIAVTNPTAFVEALYANAEGRIAYLYDVIGHLDAAHAAFALGLWLPDRVVRASRFQALARVASSAFDEWNATTVPFTRPVGDVLTLLERVQVDESGAPRQPSSRRFWRAAISDHGDAPGGDSRSVDEDEPIDVAWLAQALLLEQHSRRTGRLDQFGFGHRVFTSIANVETPVVIEAIRRFPRVPLLMLTLERIGIRRAATYAALSRHADRLRQLDAPQEARALAQFQGAIALVVRMVIVKTIDRVAATRVLDALADVPIDARRGYMGALAEFLARHIGPAITAGAGVPFEEALIQALAGPRSLERATPVVWEGETYSFDLSRSEAARLRRFRERTSVASVDAAMALQRAAIAPVRDVARTHSSGETIDELRGPLSRLPDAGPILRRLTAPSIQPQDLSAALLEAVDVLAADALLSFSYAIAWIDPTGRARLDRELMRRHDFGLTSRLAQARAQTPWALPRLVLAPGQPWHVTGSLLGLEMALASLTLRSIDSAPRLGEPRMLSTNRHSFALSLGLLDVFALRDADANALADAIARGERRVAVLAATGADATAMMAEIGMDGWRARALRWNLVNARDRVPGLFSLTELLDLGGGSRLDAHQWGVSALATLGCLCTIVPRPALHTAFVSRHQVGVLPAMVPDLNLRVAVLLRELHLPAALARSVLESALYDLVTDTRPMHLDDWLAVVRRARALSRERVADALAAATASAGPLSPLPSARRTP